MAEKPNNLFEDEAGSSAVEYGLVAAAIAGVLIIVIYYFDNRLGNALNNVASHIN
jgi:Flp pilus assembly pilin Flp